MEKKVTIESELPKTGFVDMRITNERKIAVMRGALELHIDMLKRILKLNRISLDEFKAYCKQIEYNYIFDEDDYADIPFEERLLMDMSSLEHITSVTGDKLANLDLITPADIGGMPDSRLLDIKGIGMDCIRDINAALLGIFIYRNPNTGKLSPMQKPNTDKHETNES